MHVDFEGDLENLREAERSTRRWARIWAVVVVLVVIYEAYWAIRGLIEGDWVTFLFLGGLAVVLGLWGPKSYRADMLQARLFGELADVIEKDMEFYRDYVDRYEDDKPGDH